MTKYVYEDGSGTGTTAQYVRLAKTTYPSGTSYKTDYGTSNVDVALVRTIGTSDSSNNPLVRYSYLGAGQIIKTSRPYTTIGLNLTAGTKANHYVNLDRYGRWKELVWQSDSGTTKEEDRLYTYDRMGNVLSMENVQGSGVAYTNSQTFAYDGLNRLTAAKWGQIISGSIAYANTRYEEAWTLDSLGTWRSHTQDEDGSGTYASPHTDTREVNEANEITSYVGTRGSVSVIPPLYDAAGNIWYTGQTGNESAPVAYEGFDAWNRQVWTDHNDSIHQTDLGDIRVGYDGLGRLIRRFVDGAQDSTNNVGTTEEYYYNEDQQVLEVYAGAVASGNVTRAANPKERNLWDASYVNAAAMTELDNNTTADGTVDQRLAPTWDANYNVVGLVAPHGHTISRGFYRPYGEGGLGGLTGNSDYSGNYDPNSDWFFSFSSSPVPNFKQGFQGMRWDADAGQYLSQTRRYLPGLGTWNGRDPLGTSYQDGMSLYQFVEGNPINHLDATGKAKKRTWADCYDSFNKRVAKAQAQFANDMADATGQGGVNSALAIIGGGIIWLMKSTPAIGATVVVAEGGASIAAGILDAHSASALLNERLNSAKAALDDCLNKAGLACSDVEGPNDPILTT